MELYKRLPNELQQIIKYYVLCSPHKQSLSLEHKRTWRMDIDVEEGKEIITCNNRLKDRVTMFGVWEHAYFEADETKNIIRSWSRRLLWYYYTRLSNRTLIDFINSNVSKHNTKGICRIAFDTKSNHLDRYALNELRNYLYHFV
jgi:hypothetical protein